MSVRGPALPNTDLRSRHAYMRLAVAHATIPPRRTAPTRPGRRRPAVGRWPGPKRNGAAPPASRLLRIACGDGPAGRPGHRSLCGPQGRKRGQAQACPPGPARPAAAARVHPAATGQPSGQVNRAQNPHGKRTLSDQPPGDLQKLDRAVSYEESWAYGMRQRHARQQRTDRQRSLPSPPRRGNWLLSLARSQGRRAERWPWLPFLTPPFSGGKGRKNSSRRQSVRMVGSQHASAFGKEVPVLSDRLVHPSCND